MKLRVVFDASAVTSSGLSLNDVLYTGPAKITDVINYFREPLRPDCHIEIIIVVHPSGLPVDSLLEIQTIKVTVNKRIANLVYLALRSLQELVNTDGALFPAASKVLHKIYVDIFIGHMITEILSLKVKLRTSKTGGF